MLKFNRPFTTAEVTKLVNKAKKRKVAGVDGLVYEVLKNTTAVQALLGLFNYCLKNGIVPEMWRREIISPIPKGGSSDPRIPLSYRGISLLSVVGRLYTAGISNRLSRYLETNNLLINEQNGFRPERSCLDHIFVLHNAVRIRLNLYKDTYLTFVDFSKAFDYVQREFMLHKLLNLGIKG